MGQKRKKTLRWLGERAGKQRGKMALLCLLQILLGALGISYALLLRNLVDAAVAREGGAFGLAVVLFAAAVLGQMALRGWERYVEEASRAELENQCRSRLFSCLLKGEYARVGAVHTGEWMNRLTSDTAVVADGLTQILPGAMGLGVRLVGAIAVILFLEPGFVYLVLPGGALLLGTTYFFRRKLKRLHRKVQEADGGVRVFLQETLGSLLVVKAYVREEEMLEQSAERMEQHRRARMQKSHFSNLCNIGFGGLMNGAYVLGAAVCGYGILTGVMSYGTLMAILQLIGQVQNPLANLTGYLPRYYAMLASAERLMEAECYPEEEGMGAGAENLPCTRASFCQLCLEDASFSYHREGERFVTVLYHLNLEIQKGDYVAITGPSGCGKSTFLKLLLCLYPLESGERWLVREGERIPLRAVHRPLFAYVPQGNHLMSGTIREIIAFSKPEVMDREERIWQALTIACGDGFVRELEQGLDTVLGERGTGLSEGQLQRLAIARAICLDAPILMLDEATSALDEETEQRLLANLRSMTDKTVLIVTHRAAVLSICTKEMEFTGAGVVWKRTQEEAHE